VVSTPGVFIFPEKIREKYGFDEILTELGFEDVIFYAQSGTSSIPSSTFLFQIQADHNGLQFL